VTVPFSLFRLLAGFFGLVGTWIIVETAHLVPVIFLRPEIYADPGDCLFVRCILGWPFIAVALWIVPLKDEDGFRGSTIWTLFVLIALLSAEYFTWQQITPYLS
jgi:hypothetical protein